MVNFGLLAAEIVSLVWGTPANFNGFRVLAALLYGTLVVGVSQTVAFNRGRHLYLTGRPSGWALAHISSFDCLRLRRISDFCFQCEVHKCFTYLHELASSIASNRESSISQHSGKDKKRRPLSFAECRCFDSV